MFLSLSPAESLTYLEEADLDTMTSYDAMTSSETFQSNNFSNDDMFKEMLMAASHGQYKELEFLVTVIMNPKFRSAYIMEAAKNKLFVRHSEALKTLVSIIEEDQSMTNTFCMEAAKRATEESVLESVTFLLPKINPQSYRDECSRELAKIGAKGVAPDTKKVLSFLVQISPNQSERDLCCCEAAEEAASVGHWDNFKFLVPKIADQKVKDLFCLKAVKIVAAYYVRTHLKEMSKFLLDTVVDRSVKEQCRIDAAAAASSVLNEDLVAFLGIEPDWLFQSSEILRFVASLAVEGRNSVLNQALSRMQPPQITRLLCLSIIGDHISLAATLINDKSVGEEHVDTPDSTGATALMLAADAGHHELVEKLLDLGASVRAEDNQGRTALSRAFEAGHVRVAKTLMDRGADASHRDKQGQTCAQLAERLGHQHELRLLNGTSSSDPDEGQAAVHHIASELSGLPDDADADRQISENLHQLLCAAGFTQERADSQQKMADWLEGVARVLAQDDRRMTGSYADGWANSLVQVNGRTGADSDIDWTVLVAGQTVHLENSSCSECRERNTLRLKVTEGHVQVSAGAGSQPAVAVKASGVRPAQDTYHAILCCNSFPHLWKLIDNLPYRAHLVRATRPNCPNELRVSFSFDEKRILRQLSTVQGQLFTIIKFIFKRLLPLTLGTPGLKTYNAKTLLFYMLMRHGSKNLNVWQCENLIALVKESLDMMLKLIDYSSSPDECMPHFFMSDAPLYFKNAGIGGDFDNTKTRVRERLRELRANIGFVVEQLRGLVRPLKSENFYFHPFTLLPLTAPPPVTAIREGTDYPDCFYKFADVYSVVYHCVRQLQSESGNKDTIQRQLSLLHQLEWCKCATLCLTTIAHLKFGESEGVHQLLMELQKHRVKVGLRNQDIRGWSAGSHRSDRNYGPVFLIDLPKDSDWAWRFCIPTSSQPGFPFLPEFTQTLFTARLSQPRSSHLYVNFRCLSWSLQAELLRNRTPIDFGGWLEELQEDTDLEELLTLAHYSDCREHVEFSLRHMETIRDERRVAMETLDENRIGMVRNKLEKMKKDEENTEAIRQKLSTPSINKASSHLETEDE